MITVITNENYIEDRDPYEGMSLAEACGEMSININNILNEMQMDILLTEHAYLYENGHEIEYVTEGEDNSEGKSVKQKIIKAIKDAAELVSGLWNKLIGWIQERLNDVADFFRAKGITKKTISSSIQAFNARFPNGFELRNGEWKKDFDFNNVGPLSNDSSLFYIAKDAASRGESLSDASERKSFGITTSEDFYDMIVSKNESKKYISKEEYKEAASSIYDRTFVNNVRKEQKLCVEMFNKLIKDVKSNDADKILIEDYKASISIINNFSKAAVKAWRDYVSQNVSIVKSVISDKKVKEIISGISKADRTANKFKKESVKESFEYDDIFDGKYFQA